ncbi:Putative type-1 restriction enzyme specificity protein MG438 (plasmid) [Lactococcus garvieae]|nr:Putative type-1 restriction enzyme specificity protein MG438 [Lactococcus garvieae]
MISHRTESKDQAPSRAQRLAQKGDVFYQTVRPYQMNNYLYDLPYDNYVFSTGYAQMRPNIDSYFLLNSVQNKQFVQHVLDRSTGTSYPAINSSDLSNIEIHVPSKLSEQQKIGAFFQSIDDTIALHQRKLDLLKEQKKGYLQKMFPKNGAKVPELRFAGFADDWEERKLGDITKISTGKLDANAMVENGKYDFYTSGIKKYRIDVAAFEGPSITIAGNGATVGYMHLADNKFNAYQRTYVLQEFLVDRSFIFSEIGNKLPKKIKQEARTGNIPYIVMDMLTELKLSIPQNNSEQEKIGSFFNRLDNTIALHQRKLDLLKEQKKGYLQKMFV